MCLLIAAKDVWIVITESSYYNWKRSRHTATELVGVFTSKKDAVKNARTAFLNMDGMMDGVEFDIDGKVVGEESGWMNGSADSDDVKDGEEVLFSVEGAEGDGRLVKIKHSILDQTIPQRKDSDTDEEDKD